MIIFDLDGTLADCEHRRHLVDPLKSGATQFVDMKNGKMHWGFGYEDCIFKPFKPDWDAFHEACDKDRPIQPVINIWDKEISLGGMGLHQIWSGRSESVRKKTEEWLNHHLVCFESHQLKMRPIGDYTPDEQLKEKWLDELISDGNTIEYVFDDRPKVIRMWRRRGIFVFDCNQWRINE